MGKIRRRTVKSGGEDLGEDRRDNSGANVDAVGHKSVEECTVRFPEPVIRSMSFVSDGRHSGLTYSWQNALTGALLNRLLVSDRYSLKRGNLSTVPCELNEEDVRERFRNLDPLARVLLHVSLVTKCMVGVLQSLGMAMLK